MTLLLLALWALAIWSPATRAADPCPNEAFRTGASASLSECRAYELVTPPDTNGRLVGAINTFGTPTLEGHFPTELAAPSRDSILYMSYISPLLTPGGANGLVDIYQAERSAGGWVTARRIGLSPTEATTALAGGFSSDHLYTSANVSTLNSSLRLEGPTDYLREPDGTWELTGIGSLNTEPFAQTRWISNGGEHIIFSTGHSQEQSIWCIQAGSNCKVHQLELDAAPEGTGAIYDRTPDGPTQVISLLPGDSPAGAGEEAFYKGVSKDGTAVAFAIGGTLYVRLDNAETVEVSSGNPIFAGLSDDGRFLYYVLAGNIFRLDLETENDQQVNSTGDAKVVSVSADGSHVYFVSESQIGGEGTAGQPNMYGWSGGTLVYIATVLPDELEGTPGLTRWTSAVLRSPSGSDHGPGVSSARTTPDGGVLIFLSRAQLTSYDNEEHTEIYRYEDGEEGVICVSCNPVPEQEAADAQFQNLTATTYSTVIHNLTEDGQRVFFETKEPLVEGDSGAVNDIYVWRESEGGAPELDLISSGQSVDYLPPDFAPTFHPQPNTLLSITPDARNVSFLSQDVLVAGAPENGTQAIYNARVNGGFPTPVAPGKCVEAGCKPGPIAAVNISPGVLSEGTRGSGNLSPRKRKPHCRRAKHRKHKHCQKKKGQRSGVRAHARSRDGGGASASSLNPGSTASGTPSSSGAVGPGEGQLPSVAPVVSAGVFDEFGIKEVFASYSPTAAGMHPDFTAGFELNDVPGFTEEVTVSLPPGLLGNVNTTPRCPTGAFFGGSCSTDSVVGVSKFRTELLNGKVPLFNLAPPHPDREIARLGFYALSFPVFVDISVRSAGDFGVTATAHTVSRLDRLIEASTTVWGNPSDPSHDDERLGPIECPTADCIVPSGIPPAERKPFLSNPSACQNMKVDFAVKSYQLPGKVFTASAPMEPVSACQDLPFSPSFQAEPSNRVAGAPTGLNTTLSLPQVEDPALPSTATMREARVSLPTGMQINPAAADGIAGCSEGQVGYKKEVDAACPDASKLGTARIISPALSKPLQGEVFQRTPAPGRQFGLWLVTDEMGLHVKLPGEIEASKETGRLTAVFRDLPQVPTEQIELNIWGGDRAPLINPETCGTHATSYTFAPHSRDPAVSGQSGMTIDQGCNKGFSPSLHAGTTNPVAGRFSPFILDLARSDAEQNIAGFELTLPDGLLAKLKGVGLCPEGAAASGHCPADSRLGSVVAAAGAGPHPFWIPEPGKSPTAIFLAGPFEGSPFSIVTVVPAQAGPFDLGNVVVRSGLHVDRESAQAVVKANPLPQFFEGVGLTYRRLRAVIDRPGFTLNPTDCSEMAITSRITSTQGAVATPKARFQVDGCKRLKFKPKLSLKIRGGTKRSEYPALSAVVKARKGDANIGKVSVALPHSEFLAQEHIVTICTRKQFAADKCPKGSVYGKAKAWTPLLAKPLSGPVYLRSSDNPLPDLVMSLEGEIDVALVGRIDSVNQGIRTNFDAVPDAPISKFVLHMRGGMKSLLVNSTDICRGTHRATARMRAQNGRAMSARPLLKAAGCRSR